MAKNKSKRLNDIKRIIENKSLITQDEVLEELRKMGHKVSQPTVSRDIKELGGIKKDHSKKYKFTIDEQEKHDKERLESLINQNPVIMMEPPIGALWFRVSAEHSITFAKYLEKYLQNKGFEIIPVVGITGNVLIGIDKGDASGIIKALKEIGLKINIE